MIVGDGRPLRFLVLVAGGWIALRVAIVWHAGESLPQVVRDIVPLPQRMAKVEQSPVATGSRPTALFTLKSTPATASTPIHLLAPLQVPVPPTAPASAGPSPMMSDTRPARSPEDPLGVQLALSATSGIEAPLPEFHTAMPHSASLRPIDLATRPDRAPTRSRLSVSSWLIVRGGTGLGASPLSPQLGGTQGGIRADYALNRRLAATARFAAPAAGAGREVSLGIAWRPAAVPLRFVVEQRQALDRGRSGPALGVSGGVSSLPLPGGFRLDGYGQAGAILRDGVERYVDGSLRAARPVAALAGVAIDAGGGSWGGAQRGVARLDLGPSVGALLPVAGRTVRLSLDWRQRVAGNARPGSGPALSLGSDF